MCVYCLINIEESVRGQMKESNKKNKNNIKTKMNKRNREKMKVRKYIVYEGEEKKVESR